MNDRGQGHPEVLGNVSIAGQSERRMYFLMVLIMMLYICTITSCAEVGRIELTVCLRMP